MSVVGKEPVIIQLLAGAIAYLAAKYVPGLNLSDEQAFGAAATIWVLLAPFVRQLVTPTAKLEYKVEPASTGGQIIFDPRKIESGGQVSPARTVPPQKSAGPPPPPPAGGVS